jgi:hypothetical protein
MTRLETRYNLNGPTQYIVSNDRGRLLHSFSFSEAIGFFLSLLEGR